MRKKFLIYFFYLSSYYKLTKNFFKKKKLVKITANVKCLAEFRFLSRQLEHEKGKGIGVGDNPKKKTENSEEKIRNVKITSAEYCLGGISPGERLDT